MCQCSQSRQSNAQSMDDVGRCSMWFGQESHKNCQIMRSLPLCLSLILLVMSQRQILLFLLVNLVLRAHVRPLYLTKNNIDSFVDQTLHIFYLKKISQVKRENVNHRNTLLEPCLRLIAPENNSKLTIR